MQRGVPPSAHIPKMQRSGYTEGRRSMKAEPVWCKAKCNQRHQGGKEILHTRAARGGDAACRGTAVDHAGQCAVLGVCCGSPQLTWRCSGGRHTTGTGGVGGVLLNVEGCWQGSSGAQGYGGRSVDSCGGHAAQAHPVLAACGCRDTQGLCLAVLRITGIAAQLCTFFVVNLSCKRGCTGQACA